VHPPWLRGQIPASSAMSVIGGVTTIDLHEETLWVSTARKAPARSSGVGNAATMSRVTLVAASGLTATGAKP
jgi:hypothetical protein